MGEQQDKSTEDVTKKPEKVSYPLRNPVTFGSGADAMLIDVLEFSELKAVDIEDLKPPFSIGDYLTMAARSSGQPRVALRKMSAFDANQVGGIMLGFLVGGQETGS
ncbi:MAG: hypothetical protein R3F33_11090 [Planctomycetota bacterium]